MPTWLTESLLHPSSVAATKRRLQPAVTGEPPVPPRNSRGARKSRSCNTEPAWTEVAQLCESNIHDAIAMRLILRVDNRVASGHVQLAGALRYGISKAVRDRETREMDDLATG